MLEDCSLEVETGILRILYRTVSYDYKVNKPWSEIQSYFTAPSPHTVSRFLLLYDKRYIGPLCYYINS